MNLKDVQILGDFLDKDGQVVAEYDHICFGRLPYYMAKKDYPEGVGLTLEELTSIKYFKVNFANYTTSVYGNNIVTTFVEKLNEAIREVDGFISYETTLLPSVIGRKSIKAHYKSGDIVLAEDAVQVNIDLANSGNIATFWLCAVLRHIQTNPDVVKNTLKIMELTGRNFYQSLVLACGFKFDEDDRLADNPEAYIQPTYCHIYENIDLSYYLSKDVQENFVSSFDYRTDKYGKLRKLEDVASYENGVFIQDEDGRVIDYGRMFTDVSQFDAVFIKERV